jgi:proteic killer suppression protein
LIKPYKIELTRGAKKDLMKVPQYIKEKLLIWVDSVERMGIGKTRSIPGYNDELLKGERLRQRSIRLNRAYRAIYIENEKKEIVLILYWR